jgi:hypothetical protein
MNYFVGKNPDLSFRVRRIEREAINPFREDTRAVREKIATHFRRMHHVTAQTT